MNERVTENSVSPTSVSLLVVDGLTACLVFGLPFIMGGREAWGHWFVITVAFLLGTAWCVHAVLTGARYRLSWLEYLFAGGLLIAWLQVQPQSPDVLQTFSGEYGRLLAFWPQTQSETAGWSTLSLTPVETRHGFWMLIAYMIIGLVVFQRIRTTADGERLLKWVGLSGLAMSLFGLAQWGLSNGHFFWFYEHPYTDTTVHLKGAFTNRNHFAQFMALSLGALLWWLVHETRRLADGTVVASSKFAFGSGSGRRSGRKSKDKPKSRRRELPPVPTRHENVFDRYITLPMIGLLAATCVVGLSVLLSLSRGGMIAAGAVFIISLAGLWRGAKSGIAGVVALLGGGILLLSLLALTDQQELQTKVDQILSSDADKMDTGGVRRAIWAADARVIEKFPLLGTGVGSHRDVYPLYMDDYAQFAQAVMTHAESSFVHLALETGLVGCGLLVLGLLMLIGRLIFGSFKNTPGNQACTVVVLGCTVGGTLHGIVDFIWYAPAIVVTSLVLAAVGLRTSQRGFGAPQTEGRRGLWFPRLGWALMGGACVCGMMTQQPELFSRIQAQSHWYAALNTDAVDYDASREAEPFTELQPGDTVTIADETQDEPISEPEDEAILLAGRIAHRKQYLTQRMRHMQASLRARPNQHHVQLALAEQAVKLFDVLQLESESPFSLGMLRDAASTGFDSREQLRDWLEANCGARIRLLDLANRLARRSLAGCPVQGFAYLTMMRTGFLDGPQRLEKQALIDQALLVRGHDPRIRLAAGREALVAGDQQTALELWKTVFHSTQTFRMDVIRQWAHSVPAAFFLEQFSPNGEELHDLLSVYDTMGRKEDSDQILQRMLTLLPAEADSIEDDDERLQTLMDAYLAARRLERLEDGLVVLEKAIIEFPFAFDPRYHMGMTLVELERGGEAMEHLNWCYHRDPGHLWLPKLMERARKQELAFPEIQDGRLSQL